jgi:hypothetical protein
VLNRTWEIGDFVAVTTALGESPVGWISTVANNFTGALWTLEMRDGSVINGTNPRRPSTSAWTDVDYDLNERMRLKLNAKR